MAVDLVADVGRDQQPLGHRTDAGRVLRRRGRCRRDRHVWCRDRVRRRRLDPLSRRVDRRLRTEAAAGPHLTRARPPRRMERVARLRAADANRPRRGRRARCGRDRRTPGRIRRRVGYRARPASHRVLARRTAGQRRPSRRRAAGSRRGDRRRASRTGPRRVRARDRLRPAGAVELDGALSQLRIPRRRVDGAPGAPRSEHTPPRGGGQDSYRAACSNAPADPSTPWHHA